jgi:hypothetical protein
MKPIHQSAAIDPEDPLEEKRLIFPVALYLANMSFLRRFSPPNKQVLFLLLLQVVATLMGNTSAFTTSLTTKQFTTLPFQTPTAASKWKPIPLSVAVRLPCSTKSKLTPLISIPTRPVQVAAGPRRALFQPPQQHQHSTNKQSAMRSVLQRLHVWWNALKRSIRRAVVVVMASALIWMSTAGTYTPPAAASSNVIERVMPSSSSQDQIVDKYIRRHMFDTDDATMADPLESAYREAFSDYQTDGSYPRALKEVMADVLGKRVAVGKKAVEGNGGFLGALQGAIKIVERGTGVSEATAVKVVGGTLVVTIPSVLVLFALSLAQQSKRSMNRLMKERYGESYT